MATQNELRRRITDDLIRALRAGGLPPWRMGWTVHANGRGLPTNAATGRRYSGVAPVHAPGRGPASTIGGQPIDAAALARMKAAFERSGGTILQGADIDEYLLWRARQMGASNVGGITDNAKQVLLPTNPSRSAVFEEFIHTAQHRTGKVNRLVFSSVPPNVFIV